jgi:hypothetical protein
MKKQKTTDIYDLMPYKAGACCIGHGCSIASCPGRSESRRTLTEAAWDGVVKVSFSQIMAFQHEPVIQRMVDQLGWEEAMAREVFEDLKRFFYLCGKHSQLFAAPLIIDEIWHEFQLFSQDYREFCAEHIGFFVDHQPKMRGEIHTEEVPIATLTTAMQEFGELSANWRFPSKADLEMVPRSALMQKALKDLEPA